MALISYTARVEENGSLTLPEEAREALDLKPGEEIEVLIPRNGTGEHDARSRKEEDTRRQALLQQMYAEADAVERQPVTYSNPQKAQVADLIAEKHRRMGMKV